MNEAPGNPLDDKSGIGETITTALRQPSFLRVVLLLAALVVVFVGMRMAAPILDPILFAAAPLTIFLILMLDTFPETRWLSNVMGSGGPEPEPTEPQGVKPG